MRNDTGNRQRGGRRARVALVAALVLGGLGLAFPPAAQATAYVNTACFSSVSASMLSSGPFSPGQQFVVRTTFRIANPSYRDCNFSHGTISGFSWSGVIWQGGAGGGPVTAQQRGTNVNGEFVSRDFVVTASGPGTYPIEFDLIASNENASFTRYNAYVDGLSYSVVGPPSPPQGLSGSSGPGVGQISLSWSPPASNGNSAITAYEVWRDGTLLAGTGSLSYVDNGQYAGQCHSYFVRARNGVGVSGSSNTVTACGRRETTAPVVVVASVSPAPNGAGWNNTRPVTVHWGSSDPAPSSGSPTVPPPSVVSAEGISTVTSGPSCDGAGNCATGTATVRIDTIAPTITATASPAANGNGFNSSSVTVQFTCSDAGSGVPLCPADVLLASEGLDQFVTRVVSDRAGNSASVTAGPFNIDRTTPSAAISSGPTPDLLGTVNGTAADALAGVATVDVEATNVLTGETRVITATLTNCTADLRECDWSVEALVIGPGSYDIRVITTDRADNIDAAGPTQRITAVPAGSEIGPLLPGIPSLPPG